jgi:hypothetical protein
MDNPRGAGAQLLTWVFVPTLVLVATVTWAQARVESISDGNATLSVGANDGITVGTMIKVKRLMNPRPEGEADPRSLLGLLRVTQVAERSSVATIVRCPECEGVYVGAWGVFDPARAEATALRLGTQAEEELGRREVQAALEDAQDALSLDPRCPPALRVLDDEEVWRLRRMAWRSSRMPSDDAVLNVVDLPPVIELLDPKPGELFRAGGKVVLRAKATDPDGSIKSFSFCSTEDCLPGMKGPGPLFECTQALPRSSAPTRVCYYAIAYDDQDTWGRSETACVEIRP